MVWEWRDGVKAKAWKPKCNGNIYPLVNACITNHVESSCSTGKSTISMAMFNSKLLKYQKVVGLVVLNISSMDFYGV